MALITVRRALRSLFACASVLGTPLAGAQPVEYRLDAAHTRVHWEVSHFGTSTSRGRFDDITGSLQFDRTKNLASVSIVVGTASVNTGVAPLDGIVRRAYLRSADHPQAWFVASARPVRVDAPFEISGELTLRGVSRPVLLRSAGIHCYAHPLLKREVCGADLSGEMIRSDFDVTDGLPFIGDRVRLQVQVEGIRD
jgi:polyisoprenoid-binding protein YceI